MLNLEQVRAFVKKWNKGEIETIPDADGIFQEIIDTLEAALKVVEAAITLDRIANFGDGIYDVRDRELKGWEGPKVVEYGRACTVFSEGIKPFTAKTGEA